MSKVKGIGLLFTALLLMGMEGFAQSAQVPKRRFNDAFMQAERVKETADSSATFTSNAQSSGEIGAEADLHEVSPQQKTETLEGSGNFSKGSAEEPLPSTNLGEPGGEETQSMYDETLPLAGKLLQEPLDEEGDADGRALNVGGFGMDGTSPYANGYYGSAWRLHEGFNAQFSLNVGAGFGHHAPKGVMFGQHAAFAYVLPLTEKLSFAGGIYASNVEWGSWRRTDVGFAAMVAYQLTDKINLYAFGAKSFLPRDAGFRFGQQPFPIFMDEVRDRLGAAAEFKIGEKAMIGVSVEAVRH